MSLVCVPNLKFMELIKISVDFRKLLIVNKKSLLTLFLTDLNQLVLKKTFSYPRKNKLTFKVTSSFT